MMSLLKKGANNEKTFKDWADHPGIISDLCLNERWLGIKFCQRLGAIYLRRSPQSHSYSPHAASMLHMIAICSHSKKKRGGKIMNQQFKMAKQMIDMQRASAEGMIKGMIMMWDRTFRDKPTIKLIVH
jgi:hypothetical protein